MIPVVAGGPTFASGWFVLKIGEFVVLTLATPFTGKSVEAVVPAIHRFDPSMTIPVPMSPIATPARLLLLPEPPK